MPSQGGFDGIFVEKIYKASKETIVKMSNGKHYLLSQMDNDDVFDKTAPANKDSFVLTSTNTIVHNMYDLDKLWYHQQAARRHRYPYETDYDYQHIYRMPTPNESDGSFLNIAKASDTFYAIDSLSTGGHSFVNDEMYLWLLKDNGFSIPPNKTIATTLYFQGTLSDDPAICADIDKALDYYTPESLSAEGIHATSALIGVQYNTIYEIPGSIKQDYTKGEIVSNTFKAKNQFNAKWTMEHDSQYVLENARKYIGVYSCGPTVWFKYKEQVRYKNSTSKIEVAPDWHTSTQVSASEFTQQRILPEIEVLDAVNRGVEVPQHKSTLYSLHLNTDIFDKLSVDTYSTKYVAVNRNGKIEYEQVAFGSANKEIDQNVKRMLKAEIKNCIRMIAESIAPANTQLFSVTIN